MKTDSSKKGRTGGAKLLTKSRTARFLVISIACISVLCVLVFSYLTVNMNSRSAETIGELGRIYMSGMSEQAAAHFGTAIELRLSQVVALVDSVPPSGSMEPDSSRVALSYNARARGFERLALLGGDGSFEMIFGSPIIPDEPESFLSSLESGEETMSSGHGASDGGGEFVIMGVPAAYPMDGGGKSVALVAALPVSYISDTLSLDPENEMIYYFIIDRNGNFIVRDSDIGESDYFERVRTRYDEVDGLSAEEYISALQASMDEGRSYTSEFLLDGGERRFLYGTPLPYSDWYLMIFLPYGQLDRAVSALGGSWSRTSVFSCALILVALLSVFSVYYSMTRRHVRELEDARRAAERASRAKSEFLSNMSHDIRTPMNGIIGMTAIAAANNDNPAQVQSCLRKISLSGRHLLGLINDILDMSKIESGKLSLHPEQMSLQDAMQGIVGMAGPQAGAKRQRFDVYVYNIISENVFCDSVRLNQILLNLIGNAIKFTPEGGSIHVACYEEESPRGKDFVRVHLSVKDTGIGMAPEFMARIFDSFSREDDRRVQKTEGSGLGMAITKYIVDAMGGEITVESEQNVGTEFHVTLDLEAAPADEKSLTLPPVSVLVVDDDELLCRSAAMTLGELGCRADWVTDGESAVSLVRDMVMDGKEPYRFILLDLHLPGIDGLETARRLRRLCGSTFLLISAVDWTDVETEATAAGISGAISKPLFRSNLYYGLRDFCGPETEVAAPARERISTLEGKRVIIAEDNDLNWEIASELLSENLGLELERAENGKVCFDMFANAEPGTYDAILMDIRMPVMTGYEATRAIRSLDHPDARKIPIIAMSADAFSEDVQRCLKAGMNAHAAKPIDIDELARLLIRYIYR